VTRFVIRAAMDRFFMGASVIRVVTSEPMFGQHISDVLHQPDSLSRFLPRGKTGQLGVAVQSHWFSVGSVVPWAEAGV